MTDQELKEQFDNIYRSILICQIGITVLQLLTMFMLFAR